MIYVWVQSLVILGLVFGGGLWFGGALSKWTEKPARPAQVQPVAFDPETPMPVYHGFAAMPEPDVAVAVRPEPVVEPSPLVQVISDDPHPVKRWDMLYPVNQFGTLSVTRARVG